MRALRLIPYALGLVVALAGCDDADPPANTPSDAGVNAPDASMDAGTSTPSACLDRPGGPAAPPSRGLPCELLPPTPLSR